MIVSILEMLRAARTCGYAAGAFNVYNLEGVLGVLRAAGNESSPVILQLHSAGLKFGGMSLIALCLDAAERATVPVAIHLDHSSSATEIRSILEAGVRSVMADGSHLPVEQNMEFCSKMANLAHSYGAAVEAELGRLSGSEDGLTVEEFEARLTDPGQAEEFVRQTQVDSLAVCIGNAHGRYLSPPHLDFDRLDRIRDCVQVPLVLHGASGIPREQIRKAISLGVAKINVNTEIREAFIQAMQSALHQPGQVDLIDLLQTGRDTVSRVAGEKLRLFGSSGQV